MTSLNALTLTADQWDIVDRYVSGAAMRFEREAETAGVSEVVAQSLRISARLARDYNRTILVAIDAPESGETMITVDHAGVEIVRSLSRRIAQFDPISTWAEVVAYGRDGGFQFLMTESELAGTEPGSERVAELLAEANGRRARWREIAGPIIGAIEAGARRADRQAFAAA